MATAVNEEVLRNAHKDLTLHCIVQAIAHLRFKITMYVPEAVEFVNCSKHLADIKSSVFLFKDTGVVEQRSEIAARYILHRKVNVFSVLKRIHKSDKPWRLGGCQNISFDKYMAHLM